MAGDGVGPPGAPSAPPEGLDAYGWYIATLHEVLGHDAAAAVIGQPPGDKADCLICAYERERTRELRQAVIEALGPAGAPGTAEVPPEGRAR